MPKREKALTEIAERLARFRRIDLQEAWMCLQATTVQLLHDAKFGGTDDQSLLSIDLDIIDRKLQAESGFSSVGARDYTEREPE